MGALFSIFFGFIPIFVFAWFVYFIDRYEKEPRILLWAVFTWGAVIAAGLAYLINSFLGAGVYYFTGSEDFTQLTTGSLIVSVIEESLKGLAVLFVFLVFRREFDSILDGLVYAAIVALGFAATENAFYIYRFGFEEGGLQSALWLVFVRVILVGWQHPFYTAFIGIGIAIARLNRKLWIALLAPIAGWMLAIFFHSIHNTLASLLPGLVVLTLGTMWDWTGWLFIFVLIFILLARERRWMVDNLNEEVNRGLISEEQYRTACSASGQTSARFKALFSGRYRATNRFYLLCGKLAQKKQQRSALSESNPNNLVIANLQQELARLSAKALTK